VGRVGRQRVPFKLTSKGSIHYRENTGGNKDILAEEDRLTNPKIKGTKGWGEDKGLRVPRPLYDFGGGEGLGKENKKLEQLRADK